MTKDTKPAKQADPEVNVESTIVTAPVVIKLTLNEFCARLSETVNRPELIGAFASSERASGKASDTEEAFQARYDSFINKPV